MRLTDVWNGDIGLVINPADIGDKEIVGLTCDSRQVEPGFLFAALPGTRVDGRQFISDALARGAVCVLAPEGTDPAIAGARASLLTDPNPRRRYSLTAAKFFAKQPKSVVAITGTNGKTSVAGFTRQIWAGLGHKSASAGTLGVELGGFEHGKIPELKSKYGLTTPDSVDLHRSLAELSDLGVDHLALEASSHGLDQYRLDGIKISAAGFTNLSRDHLDYHKSIEAYLEAKLRLFSELVVDGGAAVFNADDPYADAFRSAAQRRGLQRLSYGWQGDDIRIVSLKSEGDGQSIIVNIFGTEHEIMLPLAGAFQASNALCALGLVVGMSGDVEGATAQMGHLKGIPGRLELVARTSNDAAVYVDFAHTPDALETVLNALRAHTENRLHVIFGCGGDRDPGKRSQMGEVANRLADQIVVTDDNPRSEDPSEIRAQVLSACPGAVEIGDRKQAIFTTIENLKSGDVLVVAGKGHETGQIVGDQVLPFDDRLVIQRVVAEMIDG